MVLTKLKRRYKNLNRLRQIVNILIKYGFDYFVKQLGLTNLVSKSGKILKLSLPKLPSYPSL